MRYANKDASDEDIWHALDIAQCGFIRKKAEGINAPVKQGGKNFSGGQRQRLTIARALLRKTDLYIFDDSFSALDFKTDATLRANLKTELTDAALLIIAQRVSTIRTADQIIVLDEGKVVGTGTHDELLQTCEIYQAIVASQEKKEA